MITLRVRVLPEELDITWKRMREAFAEVKG